VVTLYKILSLINSQHLKKKRLQTGKLNLDLKKRTVNIGAEIWMTQADSF